MTSKRAVVIGAGVTGLSAALELAGMGVGVDLVESSHFAGGHAIQFTCKATDRCVKCGACLVEEKLDRVVRHANIRLHTRTCVDTVSLNGRYALTVKTKPAFIDTEKCTDCGICYQQCPVEKAVLRGFSRHHAPFFAISEAQCLYRKDQSCTTCRELCPPKAIQLDAQETTADIEAEAVIFAAGFAPFDPVSKPYGYGLFRNVVTNLEMERQLRRNGRVDKVGGEGEVQNMAFIQCVGSRDEKCGHLWCSKVCCGSTLRMANLIKSRQPEIAITIYYMDIQTFGRDFEAFHAGLKDKFRWIRSIPADIYPADDQRLNVTYFDSVSAEVRQEEFDLVVLSTGITPGAAARETAGLFGLKPPETGFVGDCESIVEFQQTGFFTAGTVNGPMSIAEAVASGGEAAWKVYQYLKSL